MNDPFSGLHASPLGREVGYPERYDPRLLCAIARQAARATLGLQGQRLPFVGHDRWHAYELGWLNARGLPQVGTATLVVPAGSPWLIESKSLKLYLNSFNGERMGELDAMLARIREDLSAAAGVPVAVTSGVPEVDPMPAQAVSIDRSGIAIDHYGPPDPASLSADRDQQVEEMLVSELLKSNCPVTGQPDWASVHIAYAGPRIDRDGLLRYLVGFRNHAEFHEQCVERIFIDLVAQCSPQRLSVQARYTRRGGLDINPWRATPGMPIPVAGRDRRQ